MKLIQFIFSSNRRNTVTMANIEKLNEELEEILKTQIGAADILRRYLLHRSIFKCIKWWIFIGIVCSSVYYIPVLNWNASAIGRLVMIKWILPIYDWRHLYNARCLISVSPSQSDSIESGSSNDVDSNGDICAVCENFGKFTLFTSIDCSK